MLENPVLKHFEELLSESDVCKRFSALLGVRELRRARQNGEIDYVSGKKGAVLYHPSAVAAYLSNKEVKCQNGSGNMVNTGLEQRAIPITSMPSGTTSESERLLADHLARKFSAKRKTNSSISSGHSKQKPDVHQNA